MARATWHPYAPDQAFGHQAAIDEERLNEVLAQLESHRQQPPRAGSKAEPHQAPAAERRGAPMWIGSGAGLPVTTNIALEAAAALRAEVD
ncbi:MAG: hypothetical protein JOZ68_02805 [Acidimicrobiia bacterium]|nr:hypothetical protein [Acidimicrobiia bacterium]MBV8986683.1 hypothetical protein [Acidimicrobiia bacterium]MBV9039903.1 hypothetical protein [Acidimicrobiia bacterium]